MADQLETRATHRLSTEIEKPRLRYGDTVRITANPDDSALNGREFTVLTAESGTTNWTRDYLCEEGEGNGR